MLIGLEDTLPEDEKDISSDNLDEQPPWEQATPLFWFY